MEVKIVDVTIPGDERVNERKIENIDKNKMLNTLSANPTKLSNILKQFVGNLQFPANCLSVFDHFVILVLKGLKMRSQECQA